MKKMTRKLLVSVLSLGFAIVALGTTTFAWFTMNASADASFEFKADGGDSGILISADGLNFQSSVDLADYIKDMGDIALNPVTAKYASDEITIVTNKDLTGAAVKNQHYIEFDLYFTGNTAGAQFGFDAAKTKADNTTAGDGTITAYNLLKDVAFDSKDILAGTAIKVDVRNAMRCSATFYDETPALSAVQAEANKDESSDVNSLFATADSVRLYELGGFATAEANKEYNFTTSLDNANVANKYYQDIQGTFAEGVAADSAYKTLNEDTLASLQADTEALGVAGLNTVTRVNFKFWLEGFDADCFDAVMSQSVACFLAFTTTGYNA